MHFLLMSIVIEDGVTGISFEWLSFFLSTHGIKDAFQIHSYFKYNLYKAITNICIDLRQYSLAIHKYFKDVCIFVSSYICLSNF